MKNNEELINEIISSVLGEIGQVIKGKDEIVKKIFMAVIARGHVLLDDVPGVGKTTIATAISRVLGMNFKRIQFTPDVLPSDIVGFSMYDKTSGKFKYMPGVINDVNVLLGDEINRTSSKTQSALLEAMEERQITVDGETYKLPEPFIVIATQNNVGSAGTQLLPHAQIDRFMIKVSVGYPDLKSEMEIIKGNSKENPVKSLRTILSTKHVLAIQEYVQKICIADNVVAYIANLAKSSRVNPWVEIGISPRGSVAISHMAKAYALVAGRKYVTPEDVRCVFSDVCAHRIVLSPKAKSRKMTPESVLQEVLNETDVPDSMERALR